MPINMAVTQLPYWESELTARLANVMPEPEMHAHLPLIEEIRELKHAHQAVIVAHNYQIPAITPGDRRLHW